MRKSSFRLILAALAATAALTACTKETTPPNFENDKVDSAAEGTRVIAVSFAPQTKTRLDGLTPKFADGDSILLVNSKNITEARKVSVDDKGIATISTNLTGDLTAFYPAKAAQIDGRGNYAIYNTPVQTGKFADANLCSAAIGESDTNVEFLNLYSLFIITPPDGTVILKIKSLKGIGEDGQRSGNSVPINIINSVIEASKTITLPNGPDEDGKYYVAIANARLSDLSFEAWFDENGTTGSIKGIPTSMIEQQAAATGIENYGNIQSGIAYTIDDKNWHEYVTVGVRKWATMNVGAEKPEDAGRYFAWGDTLGQVRDTINDIPFEIPYDWANAPFNNGSDDYNDTYFKSVMANVCPNGVLSLKYDAANVNWGGAWRMPTEGELKYFEDDYQFVPEGIKSGDLLLPKTGYVKGTNLQNTERPYYLSSCIDTDINGCPPGVLDGDSDKGVNVGPANKICNGFSIRAIIDEPDAVTPPTPEEQEDVLLPGCFTVGSDKEVYFTKGNLYWDGSKWAIEENQYDFSPYSSGYVSNHVSLLFWTKDADNAYAATCPESEDGATDTDHMFCDGSDANHFLTIGGNTGLYALSFDEWNYLLNTRTYAGSLHSDVSITVEGGDPIYCLAIAPDRCIGGYSFSSTKNTYTLAEYTDATAAGVLFLPVAGFRLFGSHAEAENAMCGYYWTSTPSDESANVFDLADTQFENSACGRGSGSRSGSSGHQQSCLSSFGEQHQKPAEVVS